MNMKKIAAAVTALAVAFTSAFSLVPVDTQAKSYSVQYKRLLQNKTYKSYDITGDGKADTFKYKPLVSDDDDEMFAGLKLTVNGKSTTIPASKTYEYFFNTAAKKAADTYSEVSFIRLKNGTTYLYCSFLEYNEYSNSMIFQYDVKKNKFYRKANISGIFGIAGYHSCTLNKVTGNTFLFTVNLNGTTAGLINVDVTYGYVKESSGKVLICPVTPKGKKKTDNTYTISGVTHQYLGEYNEEEAYYPDAYSETNLEPMTAKYKLKMYSDPTTAERKKDAETESAVTIAKGTAVTLTKLYINKKADGSDKSCNAFFVKTEEYGNGWIKDIKYTNTENDVTDGAFEECLFAG